MHRLRKTALALALGETVTLATSLPASAQTAVQPNVLVKSSQPAETPQETTKTREAQGQTQSTAASTTLSGGPQPIPSATGGGGYSWRDKRPARKAAVHGQKQKVDPLRPQAKGPEFAVSIDGTSRISVQLSQRVEVTVTAHPNQYVYELPNTQVPVPNDTNPLVTSHFSTPVKNIRLIARGKNALLIVELRESAKQQHQVRALPSGIAVLEITMPKATSQVTTSSATIRHKAQSKTARSAKE
jgi:hypothetical protein